MENNSHFPQLPGAKMGIRPQSKGRRRPVYKDPEGPRKPGALPAHVVVDFPGCTIPPEEAWDPENPTHIPVPVVTLRCEKDCCATTVPLQVCKAITICKCQGMTVGEWQFWMYLVVLLPKPGSQPSRTPGLV